MLPPSAPSPAINSDLELCPGAASEPSVHRYSTNLCLPVASVTSLTVPHHPTTSRRALRLHRLGPFQRTDTLASATAVTGSGSAGRRTDTAAEPHPPCCSLVRLHICVRKMRKISSRVAMTGAGASTHQPLLCMTGHTRASHLSCGILGHCWPHCPPP